MADTTPVPLSPDAEDLIAFRLAKKALRYMALMFAPLLGIAVWLGYDSYKGVKERYDQSIVDFTKATQETRLRADTLNRLADSLQRILAVQTAQLENNGREAEVARSQLRDYYSQLTQQAADLRSDVRSEVSSAVTRADTTSARLVRANTVFQSNVQSQFQRLMDTATNATQNAQRAVKIAEESRVQTVGARQRRPLYGTPFDVYFSGVSRDALRDFVIFQHDGAAIEMHSRLTGMDVIEIPRGRPQFLIQIVNVLDIPGGLLRLNGSSRADAATFRVTRVPNSLNKALTTTQ
ncbi:MAG TPA: hypothetical protein VF092_10090 [Longimicrobium sp.]